MTNYIQGDVVTFKGSIELITANALQVIVKAGGGVEKRVEVGKDQVVGVEPGPIKQGHSVKVAVGTGKNKADKAGVVVAREGDKLWVSFDDGSDGIYSVDEATR